MDKDKQTVHYCTILSGEQWDFILEGRFSAQRQRCLHRLMTHAVRTKTVCNIKGIEIALEVGEVAASDVELAEYLGCNRKTIGKLIDCFNRLGVLTTRTNNRTSIHTLHFLTGWYIDGVLLTNPHYVRPSANVKEHADGRRTPSSDERLSQNGQSFMSDNRQCREQEADITESGAAALSSSLCSSMFSDRSADRQDGKDNADHPRIIDSGDALPDGNHTESHNEPQDGTIGGADDTDTGTEDWRAQRADFSGTPLSWRE